MFGAEASIVATAQREIQQIYPQPGWVEHDAREIASSQLAVAKEVSANREIAAIGITNQRETTILWDRKTGEPIANAIVWQDRRTAAMLPERSNTIARELVVPWSSARMCVMRVIPPTAADGRARPARRQ